MVRLSKFSNRFAADKRGAIAIITAIVMVPVLLFAVGVPIDIGRQVQLRSNLQNITDTASLAASILIAQGATPAQACAMANGYMQQQEFDEGVPTSSVSNGTSFVSANGPSISPNSSTSTTPCPSPGAVISPDLAPYQVISQATGIIPTTFMSFLKPSLTMTATSAVNGPLDFTTACVTPNASMSSDVDTAYYYLVNTDGSRVNADEVTPVNENEPEYPDGSPPSPTISGVDQAQELLDNQGNKNSVTLCPGSSSQYAIPIKIGLGERVAFEMTNQTAGKYPCNYATTWKANGTLPGTSTNYTAGSSFKSTPYTQQNIIKTDFCLSSGNTYNGSNGLTYFATNAYGSIVDTTNRFYSSDYPATLNTSNALINLTYYGTSSSTGDFSTTVPQTNGFSPANQSTLMGTLGSVSVLVNGGYIPPNGDIVWFASNVSQPPSVTTKNLVCLVNTTTGTAYTAPNEASTTYTDSNGIHTFTNAGSGMPNTIQAQPLIISTNSTASNALGAGVYQCADNTIASPADPYNANPTCAELNGATLQYSWDDMGGYYNDVIAYGDLTYSYSCTNTVSTYTTPALVQ